MIKISIIVPVYNAEKYLKRCLESCINQTLDEIEIILIDDCSTDQSLNIINEYKQLYPSKVIVLHSAERGRQGAARNEGISISRGEYIAFVDSDDWIELDMCEELYKNARTMDADISGCNYFFSNDTTDRYECCRYNTCNLDDKSKDLIAEYVYFCGPFWTRIYRRTMILDNNILFLEGTDYEDSYFNFLTALYAQQIVKTEKAFYHYFNNEHSITRERNNNSIYDKIDVINKIIELCRNRNLYDRYRAIVDFKYFYMMGSTVIPLLTLQHPADYNKYISIRNGILKNTPYYYKNKYFKIIDYKLRLILYMLMHFPKLLFCLVIIIKSN